MKALEEVLATSGWYVTFGWNPSHGWYAILYDADGEERHSIEGMDGGPQGAIAALETLLLSSLVQSMWHGMRAPQ